MPRRRATSAGSGCGHSLMLRRWGAVLASLAVLATAAQAEIASDRPAAILVFPKLVVDTAIPPNTARGRIDTLIKVSNTSDQPISLHCFYVNANGHCTNAPATICDPYTRGAGRCDAASTIPGAPCTQATQDVDCGLPGTCVPTCGEGFCEAGWQEINFRVRITARQPVAWLASEGASLCDQSPNPLLPCFPLGGLRPGFNGQDNADSSVPPVPEDPFVGELKCIAVDLNDVPVERNHLKGEAELIRSNVGFLDVAAYNAIGIPAIPGRNDGDATLVLGGRRCIDGDQADAICVRDADCPGGFCADIAEYEPCPNILILDHFFDGANDPISLAQVNTSLTLVPCSEDFETQNPLTTPVQFLVFNEFEQRFSTSRQVTCFHEFRISDIDKAGPNRSIFSAAVNGTLTGQTRLRGVANDDRLYGHTFLGVAEEFRANAGTVTFNLHFHGSRPQSDFIYLP